MSIKKTVAIAAAAGALAAISVPAMAFENEFHGLFNAKFYLSNFDDGASGYALTTKSAGTAPTAVADPGAAGSIEARTKYEQYVKDKAAYDKAALSNGLTDASAKRTANFFEQRARLSYIAKASNDLKLVTQFELDSTFGGNGGAGYKGITGGNTAGQLDADSITLETKHVYLDFNAGPSNVKVGILPYKDAFKGIYLDADVSAVATSTKVGDLTLGAAFARIDNKTGGVVVNDFARDLFLIDTSYSVNKDTKVGFSYYLDANYTTAQKEVAVHTLGVNADVKAGALGVSGFAVMQAGNAKNAGKASTQYHGYALNAAANITAGPGKAKTAILFTSGDGNSKDNHQNAFYNPGGDNVSTYSESGMMILNRNTGDDGLSTDHGLAWSANNKNRGMILYTLGYDATMGKTILGVNAGMLWNAKSAGAPVDLANGGRSNAGDLMATELNVQAGYKVYDNLTAKFQVAYAILGGYYNGSATNSTATVAKDPENPYTVRLGLSYAF